MEEVEEAFKKSQTVEDFEKRLNEIYEGDGLVLVRAKDEEGQRVIEGYEDLNRDNDIVPEQDDLLFTITNEGGSNNLRGNGANQNYRSSFGGGNFGSGRFLEGYEDLNRDNDIVPEQDDLLFTITNEGGSNNLRGNGANQNYRSSFGGGNFLFTYLIFSSLTRGGYGYYTPRSRGAQMESQRSSYRNSTAYAGGSSGGQVKRNSTFYNKQRASTQLSPARQSYIGRTKTSGAFRSSNTGVRSGFGKFGGSTGRAGGGGGAQSIIKRNRW